MKRLALLAALVILPACTTFHPDRRTATEWNWTLVKDTVKSKPKAPCDAQDADGLVNPVINWVIAIPEVLMLPGSWAVDTFILNPIDGFKKAQLQTYNRRYGDEDERGGAEAGLRNGWTTYPSMAEEVPEVALHWIWNSIYWTDPVNKDQWNQFWNDHNERSTQ